MAKFLGNLHRALALGVVLLIVVIVALHRQALSSMGAQWANFFVIYLHILAGVLWIGLLWYFNFVQTPTMPKIPAELKPGVSKYIAPSALFFFRWSAAFTILFGLGVAQMKEPGGIVGVLTISPGVVTIGVGMWLAIIMAANVWFVIWPNQKKVLGIVTVDDAAKAKAGVTAGMASRINTVLSIPMLYCMVMQGGVGG